MGKTQFAANRPRGKKGSFPWLILSSPLPEKSFALPGERKNRPGGRFFWLIFSSALPKFSSVWVIFLPPCHKKLLPGLFSGKSAPREAQRGP